MLKLLESNLNSLGKCLIELRADAEEIRLLLCRHLANPRCVRTENRD